MESRKGRDRIIAENPKPAPAQTQIKTHRIGALAVAAGAASVAAAAWSVRGRSSSVFATSHWRGDAGRKSVALTFDDGPSLFTPRVLEILAQYRARATFFAIGAHVERHPQIAREITASGHDIENHSYSHPLFALGRPSSVEHEFARAQIAIANAVGRAPCWLRAPYGVRWFGFREAQRKLGLESVMWSVIGLDWKLPGPAISSRVLSRIRSGDIICLHDGRGTLENPDIGPTIDALRRILPELTGAGYHFETVSEILWAPKQRLTTN